MDALKHSSGLSTELGWSVTRPARNELSKPSPAGMGRRHPTYGRLACTPGLLFGSVSRC